MPGAQIMSQYSIKDLEKLSGIKAHTIQKYASYTDPEKRIRVSNQIKYGLLLSSYVKYSLNLI